MSDPSLALPDGGSAAQAPTVLMSRPINQATRPALGSAHYSYGFAADAFARMFGQGGYSVRTLANPEQFKNKTFAQLNDLPEGPMLHLIFRSTEDIRRVEGAYNVACFAWEFEALKANALADESMLLDQAAMLRTCDEVWTPSTYARDVLKRHDVTNVRVIPAPISVPDILSRDKEASIKVLGLLEAVSLVTYSAGREADFQRLANERALPLEDQPRLKQVLSNGGAVFLAVCNPYDKRKNLASLIEGFVLATEGRDDAVLIVKLVNSGQFDHPSGYLFHQMRVLFGNPHCIDEDRVILFSAYLSDEEMAAMYGAADFYVCTSIGEGQNLPLLEAMAHGCIPVSVQNTAMRDYIAEDASVVIAEASYKGLVSGLAADIAGTRVAVSFADRFQVCDAVTAALELSADARQQKSVAAREVVREKYDPARLLRTIETQVASKLPKRG
jgi:glycosyltransferase involved in cell wall biosynthesis